MPRNWLLKDTEVKMLLRPYMPCSATYLLEDSDVPSTGIEPSTVCDQKKKEDVGELQVGHLAEECDACSC